MGDSRIKDVSSLLSAFFDEEKLRRGERYSDFFSSWPAFVGSRLASHSRVADVDKGLLIVEADHPGWIQLLQMRQSSVLEAVAQRFPELKLRGIVFRVSAKAGGPGAPGSLGGAETAGSPAAGQVGAGSGAESAAPGGEDNTFPDEEAGAAGQSSPGSPKVEDPEFLALFDSLKRTMGGKGRGGQSD